MKYPPIFAAFLICAFCLALIGCGGGAEKGPAGAETTDGAAIFRKYCVTCHGANGKLGLSGAKDLSVSSLSLEDRIAVVTNGRGLMASYRETLTEAQIKAVVEYTLQFKE